MKLVELYGKVRYAVQIEGISRREAARRFGIYHWFTEGFDAPDLKEAKALLDELA